MSKSTVKLALLFIILFAAILRLYKIEQIPPSLNWDEVAAGYNAYTIANWGKDEWGKTFPLVFTSFRDDKHPVHVYITSIFVKLFGLSDFTTRLPGVAIGILSIYVIFYLAQVLFKSNLVSLFSAIFLAVSPYHLHFSRGLWEVSFALFFFMLGLLMFYLALQNKGKLLNISFLSFGLSILSYHSSKAVVLPLVLMLILFYIKDLRKLSVNFYIAAFILLAFVGLLFLDTRLMGTARLKQTQFEQKDIEATQVYQKTKNSILGLGEITLKQYLSHFTLDYLFILGDQSPRNSVKTQGEFYKIDAIFMVIGFLFLLKLRSRIAFIIFAWLLLSPIPASLVKGAPSASRAVFMMGSLHLISAYGAVYLIRLFKGGVVKYMLGIILLLFTLQVYFYLKSYFTVYPMKDSHEWQFGMKQIVEFVKEHEEYGQIFVTDIRAQPYIFFLYYLKHPLPEYLNTVVYNNDEESKKYNSVSYFGGYYSDKGEQKRVNIYFGGWNPIESIPDKNTLYVISPSHYDGLKNRSSFDVKKIIYSPDGGEAFYLVSGF